MIISRRKLLKALGGAAALSAATGIPASIILGNPIQKVAESAFDPALRYGNAIDVPSDLYLKAEQHIIDILMADARRVLPKDTRFELLRKIPTDYSRLSGMAWYYTPAHYSISPWVEYIRSDKGEYLQDRGVLLIGRQRA